MTSLDELEDLLRRGEKEKAYELMKEYRGVNAEILMNEGINFGIIGEYSISISYFELAEKIGENNKIKEKVREKLVAAYNNWGVAHHELKQHEKAINDYNKAIELNPNLAEAYYNRGSAYRELKQYEKAITNYNKAIELNPSLADAYSNCGVTHCELKQYEKAIENFNRAIELNPEDSRAYNNRGVAYYVLNQQEKAIKDCNTAIELNPKNPEAYNNQGNVYRKLNQQEKAIEDYNKAIELNPNFAGAYNDRGLAYYELNQQEKAIEDYNKAIELNPKYAEAYYNRGLAYGKLNKDEEAIEDYNKVIELNPEDPEAYYDRGRTYLKLKQYEGAIEDCTRAIELNPEDPEAYTNRGNAYYGLNKHEKAIEDYNKAIELNPKYAGAYSNRGGVYSDLKQYEKAIEDFNKAIELNPNLAAFYLNRGVTLVQTNKDLDKAIEDFKHARDLFEGKYKEKMLGFVEWAKARKEMNMKNWGDFRERINDAKKIFERINDPLSLSFATSIKFSYLDEKLDNALNIPDPIKALEEIETALKNLPEVEGLIDPEATIFGARVSSFAILSEFISSMRSIDENTDLKGVKAKLAELFVDSKEAEEAFEAVDFNKGKTAIVDIQEIIGSAKHEIEKIKWAANKKQKALEILKNYWSRLGPAIRMMNGISTREIENIALGREIKELKAITSEGFEKSSEEHKEILKKIHETENILMQKDAVNARYRIEIKAPVISSLSPISPKIIIDLPMGNLTEKQIEEKAEEIADKIKDLSGKVKGEFLETIKRIPEIGDKLLKRLKVRVPRGT